MVSVGALTTRPVHADQLAAGSADDALFCVRWPQLTPAGGEVLPGSLALLGHAGVLDGVEAERYEDLDGLRAAIDAGASPPGWLLLGVGGDHDAGPAGATRALTGDVLEVLQAWLGDERLADTRLVVLTAGAVAVSDRELPDLAGAGVWGLLRSAQAEHPDRLVLLDVDDSPASRDAITAALAGGQSQLALRDGVLHAPRLARVPAEGGLVGSVDGAWRLGVERVGTLEGLAVGESVAATRALAGHEVRVGVRAAGVNFRDVLIALGIYPGQASIGSEGAGVVLEIGSQVQGVRVGDRVLGLIAEAFGPVAISDERLLVALPAGWSFVQGASLPIVFLTAYYALIDLAGLQAGERVLIHGGAGGVGMAAVQLARHLGAEVFVTASPAKWQTLRAMGFDDDHIASSRDLHFKDAFLAATDGGGMDVVLDALSGEFVDASLALLPGGGRFIEMGKTDIRDCEQIAAAYPGVRYQAFDLFDAGVERLEQMLKETIALFERDHVEHLPVSTWDVRHAHSALRHLSQARHVGKVVLTIPAPVEWRWCGVDQRWHGWAWRAARASFGRGARGARAGVGQSSRVSTRRARRTFKRA